MPRYGGDGFSFLGQAGHKTGCMGMPGRKEGLTVCASSVKFSPACSTMKPSLKMGQ